MQNPIKYFSNRLKKCRVDYSVYKDKDEVDNEHEDAKKEYALFKIIDLIKDKYKDNRNEQGVVMDKLKKITNNCNFIIEKRFGLYDYLFKQKVLTQTYYDLNIKHKTPFNTFENFFKMNDLLKDSYINEDDDKAIIFKLSSGTIGTILYIRLSLRNLQELESNEYLEEKSVKIFKIDMDMDKDKKKIFKYLLINNESFKIEERAMAGMQGLEQDGKTVPRRIHNFDNISINNKELANIFKNQKGGIGKKTIKNKSKPLKNTILQKKEILGKDMRIYKINGSKKEYVKYKGNLISVSDYKKIIKLKKN
jgi:hypothetical protein